MGGRGKSSGAIPNTGKAVQFKNKTVIQNNNLFDPKAVDDNGRTNIQRMESGKAPIGYDGKPIELHHIDQTNNGPVMEVSKSTHNQNYAILHQNTGQSPSLINRKQFDQWRADYWQWRANDFK